MANTLKTVSSTALTAAPFTGPAAPFVAGIGAVVGFFSGLFPPRGNFQKFDRTAYPVMARQAQSTGVPVAIQWFNGDIVLVSPDGTYGVYVNITQNPDRKDTWKQEILDSGISFYMSVCYRNDGDCVNHPNDLKFEFYEAPGVIGQFAGNLKEEIEGIAEKVGLPSGSGLLVLIIIAIIILLVV